MLDFQWTMTFGQAVPILMTIIGIVGATVLGWFVNKVKKALLAEWTVMVEAFKKDTDRTITEAEKKLEEKIDDAEQKFSQQLADTNRRVSDLGAGGVQLANDLREFKEHVTRHYVEKNEIADLRTSMDKNYDRMESKIDVAVGTMSDVRDEVIKLTAKTGKTSVPPARRPAKAATS